MINLKFLFRYLKYYTFFPLLFLFLGCEPENPQQQEELIDKSNNGFHSYAVASVFVNNCTEAGCHGNVNPQHGLSLLTHSALVKGSIGRSFDGDTSHHHKVYHGETVYGGGAVVPFNVQKSLLYNLITGNIEDSLHRMPYRRPPLPQADIDIIKDWINSGAKDYTGAVPYTSGENIYICSQDGDNIIVADKQHLVVSAIYDLNINGNAKDSPHNIQIKGDYLYVSLIAAGAFLKIDKHTGSVIGKITGIENAGMINISADGKYAYVSRSSTAPSVYNEIYKIDLQNFSAAGVDTLMIPVTGLPHAIALTRSGTLLYAANMSKDRISILNTETLEPEYDDIVLSSGLIHEPMHIYLSPDDKLLYVNCRKSSKMLIIDSDTRQIIQELNIKPHPMQSAVSKDGNKIYTVSHHEPVITEITKTGSSFHITKEFSSPYFIHLYGADLSEDGNYLYVTASNSDGSFIPHYNIPGSGRSSLLCIYDTRSGELVKVIDAGAYATGIAAREN